MRVSLPKVLAVAAVGSLAIVYVPRPSEPESPPAPPSGAVPELVPVALRILAKDSITRAVIDGRLSLTEAAAMWGEVNRLLPGGRGLAFEDEHHLPRRPPLRTDEERLCRRVIDWVMAETGSEAPGRADEVLARLDAEFQQWRRRGTNRLPDPSGLVPTAAELVEQAQAQLTGRRRGTAGRAARPAPAR
jgi:hypothetical protein